LQAFHKYDNLEYLINSKKIKNMTIYTEEHKYLVGRLKKARLEMGLSQKEAAKLLGRSQSYLSKLESGQRRIDIITLKRFAAIYKQNIDYFIKEGW